MTKQRKMTDKQLANLKPIPPGVSGNPKGRPKKIYTILKDKGFSHDDIKTAFGEMAFYTLPELKEAHHNEENPVIVRIVANQFYKALQKSDWSKIKEILEHVIGKPNQPMDIEGRMETRNLDFYDLMIMAQKEQDEQNEQNGPTD